MKKDKTKLNKKQIKLIIVLCAVLLLASVVYTFSKYVFEIEDTHIQGAKEFYFNSDVLESMEKTYTLDDWDGTSSYSIDVSLMNYEDSIRTTESDLDYTISATTEGNATIAISSESATLTGDTTYEKSGTLTGDKQSKDMMTITITPNSTIEDYIEVSVVAKSTSLYEKSLYAKFKICVATTKSYVAQVENGEEYAYLYINSNDFSGNISVKYDSSKLILDTNNENLDGVTISTTTESETTSSEFTLSVSSGLYYKFVFIKEDEDETVGLETDGTDITLTVTASE